MNPPNRRSIRGLPYASPTCLGVKTPKIGNPANGSKEVTGIGIGSKTHQIAQVIAIAAAQHAAISQPAVESDKKTAAAKEGPKIRENLVTIIQSQKC
tara:strand:- start:379 stop:669 length:291 start_codon:yes stop_codon:yes gene_type:complete